MPCQARVLAVTLGPYHSEVVPPVYEWVSARAPCVIGVPVGASEALWVAALATVRE